MKTITMYKNKKMAKEKVKAHYSDLIWTSHWHVFLYLLNIKKNYYYFLVETFCKIVTYVKQKYVNK
jgi:hypothetical protein